MAIDWGNFLAGLERHVRANPFATAEPVQPVWEAGPPAGDADVAALETRFCVPFPPSFVDFLRAYDGLQLASHPVRHFVAAREVNWFRKKHADWVRAYTQVQEPGAEREPPDDEYFGYADVARVACRPSHFRQTIQISAVGDVAVYLLNPQVVGPSGEWEAWFLADWNPGVVRYRSFAELMWDRYGAQAGPTKEQFGLVPDAGLPTVYKDPPGRPGRRERKLRLPKPPRPLTRIARDVRDGDLPQLQRAMKELARLATPEAIQLLEQVCKHPVDFVRFDAREAMKKARRRAGGAAQ